MIGAVDIGGTKIAVGMVDDAGQVVYSSEFATEQVKNDPASGIAKIAEIINHSSYPCEGVGIGCTGPVFSDSGTLGYVEFLPGWTGIHLVQELESACHKPVVLENDANAAALGEWAWGAGQKADHFMMVTVGTGIGVGVILNGKVYSGAGGSHPEMGHQTILAGEGPVCFCGSRGCWESLASGTAMERWAQENHPEHKKLSGRELCGLAESGDPFAQKVVQRTANFLGIGLANLVTIWMPELICLSGGIMKASHLFLPEIQRVIKQNCGLVPADQVKISLAKLGSHTGLIGAAQVYLQQK
jgi:glucokinase